MISDTFYENVLCTRYSLLNNRTIDSVKTANGHVVFVHGFLSFPVGIGKTDYQCDACVVPGLLYDIVLG